MKLARIAVERAGREGLAPERPDNGPEASEYELLLAALGEDLKRLSEIQSTEKKIEAKRAMVEQYHPHISATLAAAQETGKAVQDEILSTLMLWHIDIGEYEAALDMAEHVLRHGLRMPERFKRAAATVVTEEIAQAALAHDDAEKLFERDILLRLEEMTADQDMPDQVTAKLYKALGLLMKKTADVYDAGSDDFMAGAGVSARRAAHEYLKRALKLDKNIGVKKEIERLEAALRKSEAEKPALDQEKSE